MSVVDVVQGQVEAYNAGDLERFVATHAETVSIFRPPALEPTVSGKAQLREVYRARFAATNLHAEILARIVLGNKVIDHERVRGIKEHPIEALAVYEIVSDLIQNVWFFSPDPFAS